MVKNIILPNLDILKSNYSVSHGVFAFVCAARHVLYFAVHHILAPKSWQVHFFPRCWILIILANYENVGDSKYVILHMKNMMLYVCCCE